MQNNSNYAVEISNISTTWILRIDADERFNTRVGFELEQICNNNDKTDVTGIIVRFKRLLGKDLCTMGGVYPWKKLICIVKLEKVIEDREMG